ncbi:MAG TPA: hypothetical protein VN017_04305, partial [Pseudoxanthomonas sp.]|nr:hypothetical protein [Pseudoxanthomonas sp.]
MPWRGGRKGWQAPKQWSSFGASIVALPPCRSPDENTRLPLARDGMSDTTTRIASRAEPLTERRQRWIAAT